MIAIGSDHGGFHLKKFLIMYLKIGKILKYIIRNFLVIEL